MAEVTDIRSTKLYGKLGDMTQSDLRWYYKYHEDAEKKIKECDIAGFTDILKAQSYHAELFGDVTRDRLEGRITDDEMDSILDSVLEFEATKRDEFVKALRKCDCKFKE